MTESMHPTTPAAEGYAMPPEWTKHEATWIAWPHYRPDWPGKLAAVPWAFAEMVRGISPGELVRVLVQGARHESAARSVLERSHVDLKQVIFHRWPTDRAWTRDYGPICVRRASPRGQPAGAGAFDLAVVKFHFNAWGKRDRRWKRDNRIALRAAQELRLPVFTARRRRRDFVLEGGSIDVNGQGTLLTTEQCLLDPAVQARNPGLSRAEVESALRDFLGVANVLWLGGGLVGDDTHGHVDDLCRFVNRNTVVLSQELDPGDPNFAPLRENRERLKDLRLEDGSKIEVVPLPMPAPLYFGGNRLPASYANFYIANAAVIVPTFNDPNDRVALGRLAELFADRPVVGIHAVDLVLGSGTLHCLTQQLPARQ